MGGPQTSMAYHPIQNLPHELLATIFLCYIEETMVDFCQQRLRRWVSDPAIPKAYSWLKIRHICRLWREVACTSPSLHTHIVLAATECVADQIRRSGQLPLTVYAVHGYHKLSPPTILESCRLVFMEATRIHRVLFQWTPSLDIALRNPEFADLKLPNVQNIILYTGDPDSLGPWPRSYETTPFSTTQLPRLSSYCCVNGTFSSHLFGTLLHKPLQRSLRRLKFDKTRRSHDFPGFETSTPNMFDLLDQLSLLEELELQVTSDPRFKDSNPGRRTVLSHLTHLHLKQGSPGAAISFLPHLICPSTTHVTLESEFPTQLDLSRHEALIVASRFAGEGVLNDSRPGDPHFMKLDICHYGGWVDIVLWNAEQTSAVDPITLEPPIPMLTWRAHFNHGPRALMPHFFLSLVFDLLPLSNVVALLIEHDATSEHHFARLPNVVHTFRRLAGVRVLMTQGLWLVEELSKVTLDGPEDRVFPRLWHWSIGSLDISHTASQDEARTITQRTLQQLRAGLAHRYKTGAGLGVLHLDTRWLCRGGVEEAVAAVLSPEVTDGLDGFMWVAGRGHIPPSRVCGDMMMITNRLTSIPSAL